MTSFALFANYFNPRSVFTGARHINVPSITGTTRLLFSGADCPLVGGGYRFAPPATAASLFLCFPPAAFAFQLRGGGFSPLLVESCPENHAIKRYLVITITFLLCKWHQAPPSQCVGRCLILICTMILCFMSGPALCKTGLPGSLPPVR